MLVIHAQEISFIGAMLGMFEALAKFPVGVTIEFPPDAPVSSCTLKWLQERPIGTKLPDDAQSIQVQIPALTTWVEKVKSAADSTGMRSTSKQAERIIKSLNSKNLSLRDFGLMAAELRRRFEDDLSGLVFLQVEPTKAEFFQLRNPFGEEVAAKFPSAIFDADEAALCLALDCDTASVFHLMRVMEAGLRALGKSLNDPRLDPGTNPTWERILKRGDEELQKPLKNRSAEWQQDEQFFSTAVANLRAVKDAWRNPTLHVGSYYDAARARDVYSAVRAFMRHLATRLSE
jgi:hypothetical protein